MSEPKELATGTVLDGRYEIQEKIGAGGMATVYRAHDMHLDTPCAVKVLYDNIAMHHGPAWKNFFREARILARMRHANIVGVRDVHENGICYIAMDLVVGETAFQRMRRARFGPRETCRVVAAVCDGLETGHRNRPPIIHRDIKPENILLRNCVPGVRNAHDEDVVIIDYGIAHFRPDAPEGEEQMTAMTMCTFEYASPEQKNGSSDVDHRADVFSAGAVLWALLKGRAPKDIVMIGHDDGVAMRRGIPKPLLDIIMRAVEYNKLRRFASAAEMAIALRAASKLLPEDGVDDGLFPETEEPERVRFRFPNPLAGRALNWRGLGAVAAIVLVLGGGGAWFAQTETTDVVENAPSTPVATVTTVAAHAAVKVGEPSSPPVVVQTAVETPKPQPPPVAVVQKPAPAVEKTPVVQKPKVQKTQASPDTTQRLVHKPVKKAVAGSTVTITASVKNVDVKEIWLFSRMAGDTKWSSVPIRESQDAGYKASLTVAASDIEYYVKATDANGDVVPGSGDRFTYYTISVD